MKFTQEFRQTQQLTMTPQLQQAIRLLQLSQMELSDLLIEELETNPALEEITEFEDENIAVSDDIIANMDTDEIHITDTVADDLDWDALLSPDPTGRVTSEREVTQTPDYDRFIAPETTLGDHLRWQLLVQDLPEILQEAGLMIIESINPDGYLEVEPEELITPEISIEILTEALWNIQSFDPAGVGARNVVECLTLQLYRKGYTDSDIVVQITQQYLPFIEQRNLGAIAKALHIKIADVEEAIGEIVTLSPRPGSAYGQEKSTYIVPDVFIQKIEDEYVVTLNNDYLPRLRVSPYYRKMLSNPAISDAEKKYVKEKYQSATWLLKSVYQRQRTIYKVTEQIIRQQRAFLDNGIGALTPMTLKDVADVIGVHESTVSRATSHKYVHTPQGIFELKYFFNSGINKQGAGAVASVSVQEKIRQIISTEPSDKPFSDDYLASLLHEQGLDIARRTVAKYREAMNIPSSSKRKPLKRGMRS